MKMISRRSLGQALGLVAAAALTTSAFTLEARADVVTGEAAPTFSVQTASGEALSLESLAGQTVVLEWTNHGCPYVQRHYGSEHMQSLQASAAQCPARAQGAMRNSALSWSSCRSTAGASRARTTRSGGERRPHWFLSISGSFDSCTAKCIRICRVSFESRSRKITATSEKGSPSCASKFRSSSKIFFSKRT